MSKIKFYKSRDVKTPTRGTAASAGIDFYVPNSTVEFVVDLVRKNPGIDLTIDGDLLFITIAPNSRVLIPSGIHSWMETGTALIGANKSGVASKKGLVYGAHVIDSDYTGEIHINMINTNNVPVVVKSGEKLIQFIHTPILLSEFEVVDKETFDTTHGETERGSGGFGSTGSN